MLLRLFVYIGLHISHMQVAYPAPGPQGAWSLDDLPRTVACAMNQGSSVTSMDFHPSHHTLLLGMFI